MNLHDHERERFWAKVQRGGSDECWPWLAAVFHNGYGLFKLRGKCVKAHRVAYSLANGEPQNNVLHRCDNPACCNPAHLFDGTHAQNMADMVAKGRARGPSVHMCGKLNFAAHFSGKVGAGYKGD